MSGPDSSAREREQWADLAKGICIVLVVLWHVVSKHVHPLEWGSGDGIARAWIVVSAQLLPLRMPLFFLISGFFAARTLAAPSAAFGRRVGGLLGLYVLWLSVQTALLPAAAGDFSTERATTPGEFLLQLTIRPSNLWYLLALGVYLMVARVSARLPVPIVVLGGLVISAVGATGVLGDSGNLWQVMQNLLFFLLGARLPGLLRRIVRSATPLPALVASALAAALLAAATGLGARQWFGVWPLVSAAAVWAAVVVCVLLSRHAVWVAEPMMWVGRRTLPIYVVHMIPLALLDRALRDGAALRVPSSPLTAAIEPVLITALVIAGSLTIHRVMRALGLGIMFDPSALATSAQAAVRVLRRLGRSATR